MTETLAEQTVAGLHRLADLAEGIAYRIEDWLRKRWARGVTDSGQSDTGAGRQ